jgi:type I restriction enzyme S subunit
MTKTKSFWTKCDEKSRGTSGQNRIRPERFLEIEILLPVLLEQRQIVTRIDDLDKKVAETKKLREQAKTLSRGLLSSAYTKIIQHVDYLPMSEVAPLKRRPVRVELSKEYLELGIRSFGKGTFHKPAVDGASLGTKRIFTIELGDLVFNNVFAWEGAVAVARPEDHGLVGSHRFITCVPKGGLAMSSFLCFHFLTDRGLEQLGEASPGGAGRNRTLGLEKLGKILVPVPLNGKLTWFDDILRKMNVLNDLWNEADAELGAFLPSVIANSFK